MYYIIFGASGGLMVGKLNKQTYTSEFESHWVPHSYGLVAHLSKKLSKLLLYYLRVKYWIVEEICSHLNSIENYKFLLLWKNTWILPKG